MLRLRAAVVLLALLAGCGSDDDGDGDHDGVRLPPAGARVDYQLGGAYPPSGDAEVVIRDVTAEPAPDRYGVCYVNAFQTQPGTLRWWQDENDDLLLSDDGELVTDPDWPDEALLDTSTEANRAALAEIVGTDLERCAEAGFAAVEPDNLDSWTRSHDLLNDADNLAFAALLAERAHELGLAIAQKNAPELGDAGRDTAHLDFAIAEECEVHDECAAYTDVYGRHVIEIEYTDNGRDAFAAACAARGDRVSVLLRDRDVVPAGATGYVSEWC
ncbi:endo alpha-1,4 polygalactosaminidase [Jiangella endophytica]|uniref:endo alpha-1,4 polygalactosaminidase n=1 Tax=Jiangella endophytica TaxID=1623398 RepID=UPI000E349ABC|nr:endo alpha-1,4 polygalactosaminidase [Jiangella endophytica]